jgi:hypothetical protein
MLQDVIIRVHRANFGVYGARKVWKALHRLGMDAGRDQVARLMKAVALQGVTRRSPFGRPNPTIRPLDRRISSSAAFGPPLPTGSGWPISPTSGPTPASRIRP